MNSRTRQIHDELSRKDVAKLNEMAKTAPEKIARINAQKKFDAKNRERAAEYAREMNQKNSVAKQKITKRNEKDPRKSGEKFAKKTAKRSAKKRPSVKHFSPRQIDFAIRYYLPSSKTYSNALASAKAAGFTEIYAKTITTKNLEWIDKILSEIVGKQIDKNVLVQKAKRVVNKNLEDDADPRVAADIAKFILKSTDEFSEKKEQSGEITVVNKYSQMSDEELDKKARELFAKNDENGESSSGEPHVEMGEFDDISRNIEGETG